MRAKFSRISGRISDIGLGRSGDNDKPNRRHTLNLGNFTFSRSRTRAHERQVSAPMPGSRLALTDPAPSIRHTDIDEGSIQRPRSLPPQIIWPSNGSGTLDLSFPDYASQMNTGTGTQYSTSRPPSNFTNTRMPTIRCVDCESQSGSQSQSHGPRTTTPTPSVRALENPNTDRREINEYLQPPHEPLKKQSISSIATEPATRPAPASTSASKISQSSEIGQPGFGPQGQHQQQHEATAAAAPTAVQRNTESTRLSTGTFRFYGQLNQNQNLNQTLNQDRNQDSGAGENDRTETDMADHKNKDKSSMRRMYQRIVQSTSATLTSEKQKKALRRISDIFQPRRDKSQQAREKEKSPAPSPQPHHHNDNDSDSDSDSDDTNNTSDDNDNDDTDTTKETNTTQLQLQPEIQTTTNKTPQDTHPYHPNDYWDRIRQHHQHQHQLSPSISHQSLPRHVFNIHIHVTRKPSPLSSSSLTEADSRGRLADQYHAQDLRLRSRSPRLAPASNAPSIASRCSNGRGDEREHDENQHQHEPANENQDVNGSENDIDPRSTTSPASQHSTFHSINPRTSHMGDQELPWKLRIPGDIDEEDEHEHEHGHTRSQDPAPPTTTTLTTVTTTPAPPTATTPAITPNNVENNDNEAAHQHTTIRTINEGQSPIELPAPGQSGGKDEESSDEEVVMSSTAYPGQEWRPAGFSGWEY
ncbi:hypothetical protein SI65_06428 [Aspergillus cristatus]|uniref:Uncharacterized protein n=1 Tax=Aspergillus cristatus TaxID=573508 RepID=A0A1E3BDT4_ASPCR|nr:hypothetical protein SI65_06428 [Aspergillus cristatus]